MLHRGVSRQKCPIKWSYGGVYHWGSSCCARRATGCRSRLRRLRSVQRGDWLLHAITQGERLRLADGRDENLYKAAYWFFLDVYTCSGCKIKGRVTKAQFASAIWSMARFRYVGIDHLIWVRTPLYETFRAHVRWICIFYIRRRSSPLLQNTWWDGWGGYYPILVAAPMSGLTIEVSDSIYRHFVIDFCRPQNPKQHPSTYYKTFLHLCALPCCISYYSSIKFQISPFIDSRKSGEWLL